mmetsp:Transcript_103254/g.291578  ORF Transcript_103254/g.291578 Transcript_103254/m.291578 type:complete len:326 (+) Transcript_103254:67-1044(+)|eukprot:CAMPEP_0117557598 /NCGR_PEP_ID=MMETSP0784-20121206/52408_1 /TAXON_ID=39447 /ORGANISM="" /LENGTH=325 /DNA_ID=CAMNT_0005354911 /DNA_START=67 /DNA_END=1044 /DNA_ORIENTATION=-
MASTYAEAMESETGAFLPRSPDAGTCARFRFRRMLVVLTGVGASFMLAIVAVPSASTLAAALSRAIGLSGEKSPPWDYTSFHLGDWPEKYPLCGGKPDPRYSHNEFQSPIAIPSIDDKNVPHVGAPQFLAQDGGCHMADVERNEHTLETSFNAANCTNLKATFKGITYTLLQFHFHSLSENKIKGRHTAAEMHMVHQSDDGRYLVIGMFLEGANRGPADNFLATVFKDGLEPGHEHEFKQQPINPYTILRAGEPFYSFMGSFTTPPCTPDVQWLLLKKTHPVRAKYLTEFHFYLDNDADQADSYGNVYRPVQPINGREFEFGVLD